MKSERFHDRIEAGRALAPLLTRYAARADVVVLALPRGGVPVGYEISRALDAPLDVFLVRKLGVPGHEELAMGAIARGDVLVVNESVVRGLAIPPAVVDQVASRERIELERREREFRGDHAPVPVTGRTAILVDDGLATGSSMRAAAQALRHLAPDKIVVAVPVAARETCNEFRHEVDDVICLLSPEPFYSVGVWYEDFSQVSDEEVWELLDRAWQEHPVTPS
jgi:predicted phosphoribosyltransferase